jgi:hypothetical protein
VGSGLYLSTCKVLPPIRKAGEKVERRKPTLNRIWDGIPGSLLPGEKKHFKGYGKSKARRRCF